MNKANTIEEIRVNFAQDAYFTWYRSTLTGHHALHIAWPLCMMSARYWRTQVELGVDEGMHTALSCSVDQESFNGTPVGTNMRAPV
jgi:heme/copper-type cytochrome/quinol oxidase subunit 3